MFDEFFAAVCIPLKMRPWVSMSYSPEQKEMKLMKNTDLGAKPWKAQKIRQVRRSHKATNGAGSPFRQVVTNLVVTNHFHITGDITEPQTWIYSKVVRGQLVDSNCVSSCSVLFHILYLPEPKSLQLDHSDVISMCLMVGVRRRLLSHFQSSHP